MNPHEYDVDQLFRKRISYPENEMITFEKLGEILEKTATAIPFENLCIIANDTSQITKESLLKKISIKNEGGLCYELNAFLYFFLLDNDFNIRLIRGVVYNDHKNSWNSVGRTHVANLLEYKGETYLIDTGFGGNLPLKPVPLKGRSIASNNGEFRVRKLVTEHGDYVFEMKRKHKDQEWTFGYAFDSNQTVHTFSELNEIQQTILEHEESPFNKRKLVTRLTKNGMKILTDTSLTEWNDGVMKKTEVDEQGFKEAAKEHFGLFRS
ncbi:arylamine N-acetyltransferase [Bacillus sp. SA1-12]|uniref:arylamine N-acetyltransferase family protein n=1 Tax=Bacillus sp. SA1-12 TaxID=1455638 RepID=UPI0006250B93|nr:arylamine N-acetyltransferase [Bacillus sp. SA1-12]KKI94072.1 arylamine N-acetyltransferase [Bacillus sp. SA1-12]